MEAFRSVRRVVREVKSARRTTRREGREAGRSRGAGELEVSKLHRSCKERQINQDQVKAIILGLGLYIWIPVNGSRV